MPPLNVFIHERVIVILIKELVSLLKRKKKRKHYKSK